MKKHLLILSTILATGAMAQQLPNPSFEDWTNSFFYEEPTGWATANPVILFSAESAISVTKSTDAQAGSYSAKIESTAADFDGDGIEDIIPGFIFNGLIDFATGAFLPGSPFNFRPDSFKGWAKYAPITGDGWGVQATLTKWDPVLGVSNPIAQGMFFSDATTSTFTSFEFDFTYDSEDYPDSISVFVFNTNPEAPLTGSVLWVDDFSLDYTSSASLNENSNDYFKAYPNPVTDELRLRSDKDETVQIYSVSGKLVKTISIAQGVEKIVSCNDLESGIYMIQRENGKTVKLTVTK
jgi:hypothetical protein